VTNPSSFGGAGPWPAQPSGDAPPPGYAQPYRTNTVLAQPSVRMSAGLYATFMVGAQALSRYGTSWGERKLHGSWVSAVALGISGVFALVSAVAFCFFVYRMWSAVQDGQARITPGRALGLLFVPFYNFYWVFRALPGWARDYNAYCERHGIRARAAMGPLLAAVLVIPVPSILAAFAKIHFGSVEEAFLVNLVQVVLGTVHQIAYLWMVLHVCDRVERLGEPR
jgi:hypothetical protein